jgi:hypothetical protein
LPANLPSKLESFLQTMHRGEEFTRHGVDLLSKQPSPEDYFEALKDAGFFDPKNNAGPVPSNEPGFVQIPFWPALTYLQAVAKRAGQTDDLSLAEKILGVVRSVTNFRDDNGEPRDNYHSYYRFAEIIGELPLRSISIDDVKLIRVWLTSRFEHGLVGSSLAKGLLKRLLASDEQRDTELAIRVMKECMAYEWLPKKTRGGKELVTRIDDYWLKALLDAHARRFGAKAGLDGIRIFEEGLRAIFSDSRRSYGSTLWRPAIEPNTQNKDFRDVENRFVDGMWDSLAGWIEAKPEGAIDYVKNALTDPSEIVRRIAIHTVTENFDRLGASFEAVIDKGLFTSGFRHEVYRLLQERFAALSAEGRQKVIAALRALPEPKTGDDTARRLKFMQREWLIAIKDQSEASEWFKELSSDPALGSPTDHPDFLSYHEMRQGPGPAPFGQDSLIAFADDGSLVDRLNEFRETNSWKGPTLGGLVEALEAAVAASPDTFLPLLSDFHRAEIAFQHALIAGFKRLYDPSNAQKPPFDWKAAWPKLIAFFSECLNDQAFWSAPAVQEEGISMIPTRTWMTSLIAGFLEAGTKHDETAYASELLPLGWELIKILLARAEPEPPGLTDPMTRALNTEKGRVIGALYNHALRVCRIAQQQNEPLPDAWTPLQPVFDSEIAKCVDANFEFSTLSASYIANLDYMSRAWLTDNVRKLFPIEHPANFKSAIGGLAYGSPNRPIYQLKILDAALNMELDDRHSRERIVEWICLAYLWGDENLSSPLVKLIFAGGTEDIQNGVDFFWKVRREKMEPEQVERVLAYWEAALGWARAQRTVNETLLSRLSRLAPYFSALDGRAKSLLLGVIGYVHSDYSTDQTIEQLDRLVDSTPAGVELLDKMFEANTSNFDLDNKLKGLLKKLYVMGLQLEVLRIIEKLQKTLPDMLSFYKELLRP